MTTTPSFADDRDPVCSLQGLASDRVVTIGTVSKSLATDAYALQAARDRGVGLYGMSQHRASGLTRLPQLVLGFGNLTDRAIRFGMADIADLLGASRPNN